MIMARPLRIELENGLYHVTSRGWQRWDIVRDDVDRESWLELLERVARRCGWRVFAWVLMTNHWHLFPRTPQPNLSAGMHDLNSGYASRYNRRHQRVALLFQGRFQAILVEDESHAAGLSRYIHLNPVRAPDRETPSGLRLEQLSTLSFGQAGAGVAGHRDRAVGDRLECQGCPGGLSAFR